VSGQPGAVEMLLRAGLDISNEPELDGWSPLTCAALHVDHRVLGVLLSDEGTRSLLHRRDKDGCTALWWANCLGRREAAEMLMRAGADMNLRSLQDTCVWKAVSQAGREVYRQRIGVSKVPHHSLAQCLVGLRVLFVAAVGARQPPTFPDAQGADRDTGRPRG
jgi:hypothetical protein